MNDSSSPGRGRLPPWKSVLAVVAHPDDESFGLGALLDAFVRAGTTASVLCLTRGEASTLGVTSELSRLRATELGHAARELRVSAAVLLDYPDGALDEVEPATLSAAVVQEARARSARGLLVFDPSGVSGHPDHQAASRAGLDAATQLDLPVLGWTLPRSVAKTLNEEFKAGFIGHPGEEVDLFVRVDRRRQRLASLAHESQAVPTSVLWRRLDLLGDEEHLRWLRRGVRDATTGADECGDSEG